MLRAPRLLLASPARRGTALARVAQPLGGEREIALQTAYLQPRLIHAALDVGTSRLGRVPGLHLRLARLLRVRQLRPLRGERRRQLLGPLPQAAQREIEVLEFASHQRERDPEALLDHLSVALRLAALARQAAHLGLDLAHQILEPGEVRGRLFQPALRARLAVAVQPDPGRLFEQGTPLLGLLGEERFDHFGFHHDRGVRPEARAAQQVLDVAQPHRRSVQQVFTLARAGQPARHEHFLICDRQRAVSVVEHERDFRHVHRAAPGRALEDHVLHFAAAQQAR